MFVSVILDVAGKESLAHLAELLSQYGFERVQRACWESLTINEKGLQQLKQDIDSVTDSYDTVRLYQFPIEGALAITTLYKKKWRRVLVRLPEKRS